MHLQYDLPNSAFQNKTWSIIYEKKNVLLEFFVNGGREGASAVILHVEEFDLPEVDPDVEPEQVRGSNFGEEESLEHRTKVTRVTAEGSGHKERIDQSDSSGNLKFFI